MAAFPSIFAILTDEVATPRSGLKRLASLFLADRSPVMVCLEELEPHIQVLCGLRFATPSYTSATPKDRKFLAFSRDIRGVQIPITVEIFPE